MNCPFILGTAQLGMDYGIANIHGQPSIECAKEIVAKALDYNILYFDTAKGYGTSEKILGLCLKHLEIEKKVRIITKFSAHDLQNKNCLNEAIKSSLHNLNIEYIYALLLHHEQYLPYLDTWQGEFLQDAQKKGFIHKIGVSVYTPKKALEAIEHRLIQIIQVPSSLFDRRFIEAGVFEKALEFGKEIHIRSVFLQGVLCMPPDKLPPYLFPLKVYLEKFNALCVEYNCTPSQAALFYMRSKQANSFLIFGAENIRQVNENMNTSWQQNIDCKAFLQKLDLLAPPQKPELLNPALWRKQNV